MHPGIINCYLKLTVWKQQSLLLTRDCRVGCYRPADEQRMRQARQESQHTRAPADKQGNSCKGSMEELPDLLPLRSMTKIVPVMAKVSSSRPQNGAIDIGLYVVEDRKSHV